MEQERCVIGVIVSLALLLAVACGEFTEIRMPGVKPLVVSLVKSCSRWPYSFYSILLVHSMLMVPVLVAGFHKCPMPGVGRLFSTSLKRLP